MSRMGIFITPQLKHFMKSEFLSVMIIKVAVVWNVISTPNGSEMLAQIHQTTWCHYEVRDNRLLPNI